MFQHVAEAAHGSDRSPGILELPAQTGHVCLDRIQAQLFIRHSARQPAFADHATCVRSEDAQQGKLASRKLDRCIVDHCLQLAAIEQQPPQNDSHASGLFRPGQERPYTRLTVLDRLECADDKRWHLRILSAQTPENLAPVKQQRIEIDHDKLVLRACQGTTGSGAVQDAVDVVAEPSKRTLEAVSYS